MPLSIFPNVLTSYGSEPSAFGSEQHTTTTTSTSTVLSPPGFWFVVNGAHNTVRYTPDAGTTHRTLVAASAAATVYSDGQSVDIFNDTTGGTSAFYVQILGNV